MGVPVCRAFRLVSGRARTRASLAAMLALVAVGCRDVIQGPDVVLVTVDTLRADHLGSYGFELDSSPAIDALASRGVLFERAIAASSSTAPSHASILSSRYVRQHSVGYSNGQTRLAGVTTLAEHFREAGYDTAAFVGNVVLKRRVGFDRGFDSYDDELPAAEGARAEIFERRARDTAQRALAWVDARDANPFFVWVHFQDPHGPYTAPEELRGTLRVSPGGRDPGPLRALGDDSGQGGIPRYQLLPGLSRLSEYRSRYAEEIRFADRWIGRLLERIEARGPDTIALLTADHGEAFGEQGRYLVHGFTTTPENAHVPFVLRAPGLPVGERRRDIVHHVDVLPTLLELAGLPVPDDARGVALGPVLRGETGLPERFVYCDNGAEITAYQGRGFTRLGGVVGIWRGEPLQAVRASFHRWTPHPPWRRARTNAMPPPHLRDYASQVVPMQLAPDWDAEDVDRLQALGYVDE